MSVHSRRRDLIKKDWKLHQRSYLNKQLEFVSESYDTIKSIVKTKEKEKRMKTYSSVHDSFWYFISKYCLLPLILVKFDTLSSTTLDASSPNSRVRFIIPCKWAINDVWKYALFKELIQHSHPIEGQLIDDPQLKLKKLTNINLFIPLICDESIYFW